MQDNGEPRNEEKMNLLRMKEALTKWKMQLTILLMRI